MRYFLLLIFLLAPLLSFADPAKEKYDFCLQAVKDSIPFNSQYPFDKIFFSVEHRQEKMQTCLLLASLPENRSHQKNIPTQKFQFFREDFDVPAIDTFQGSAYRFTKNDPHAGLLSLSEINDEAYSLWAKLLACSQSNPERARLKYLNNDFSCDLRTESINLKHEFSTFKINLINSLMQAQIKDFSYFDNRLNHNEIARGAQGNNELVTGAYKMHERFENSRWQMEFDLIEAPHPMVVQIALQIMSHTIRNDRSSVFAMDGNHHHLSEDYVNLIRNASNILILVNNLKCSPMGLWPHNGWTVWNRIRDQVVLIREKIVNWNLDRFDEANPHFKIRDFKWDNLVPMYSMVTFNCEAKNLPRVYYENRDYLLKTYSEMDSTLNNIEVGR